MKWICRKFTAFTLVTAMVMVSPMSVSAEIEMGSETGTGRVEATVNTDVYQVVLPTVSSHTFDFIMDPLELISQTDGAAYGNCWNTDRGLGSRRSNRKYKRHMQGSACLFFLAITRTDPHGYSSASSANRASMLPLNKVPLPLSSSRGYGFCI